MIIKQEVVLALKNALKDTSHSAVRLDMKGFG